MSVEPSFRSAGEWVSTLHQCCGGDELPGRGRPRLRAAALRVSQLDAALLDEELASLFMHKLRSACKHVRQDVESQTQLAGTADALASAFSLWLRVPRPGCSLLGLKYAAAPSDANVGLGSALTKAGAVVLSLLLAPRARAQPLHTSSGPSELRHVAACAEHIAVAASAANLLEFLRSARYRSVAERVLGAQLSHSRDDMSRILSLDFLNRQLVWRELSELLLVVLPLLHSLRDSSLGKAFAARRAFAQTGNGDPALCESCGRAFVLRCTAVPCGHSGCYFCLAAACRGSSQHACSVCSTRILAVRRA